jgi:hypothetical protein
MGDIFDQALSCTATWFTQIFSSKADLQSKFGSMASVLPGLSPMSPSKTGLGF